MVVGIKVWELHLEGCLSLKDKRSVLKPLVNALRRVNLSVAETGHQDLWQRAEIACAAVGSDRGVVEAELRVKGPNLFGREAASTYEAATDLLVDKLERQVERLRDKKVHEPRRRAQGAPPEPLPVEEIEQDLHAPNG